MLTLTDVNLGIRDLLDKRNADLLLTKAGKYYHPLLEEQRDALDALPTALTGGVPFAAELDLIDARHDGYGATIYFVTEVYLRLPDAPAAIVEAARRVRLAFIPSLNELGASYPVEAERAIEPDTEFYLGLLHAEDGAPGARSRAGLASEFFPAFLPHFGISTECGLGRHSQDQLEAVLAGWQQYALTAEATVRQPALATG